MAHENVKLPSPNFCLSPRADEFGSISGSVFRFVQSDGDISSTYSLSSGVTDLRCLEYVGPRSLALSPALLGASLPFFTLEHTSSSGCLINRWQLNASGPTFDLQSTLSLTSSGSYNFDCYAMAVENYEIEFTAATTTGTGFIQVSSVSGIAIGDILLLGPSGDADPAYHYKFEYVTVTGVVGNNVYISTSVSGVVPPINEYVIEDQITYRKNIYLFSDVGQGEDTTRGSLYVINPSGVIIDVQDSGIYSGVRAASWSRDYDNVGFVQDNNILYLDVGTYQIQRSQVMTNVQADRVTLIPVHAIIFDASNIYRLQTATVSGSDNGVINDVPWGLGPYNYQRDGISSYTRSIEITPHPDGVVLNDEVVTLVAIVRDQFGSTRSSRNVKFYADPSDRGEFSPFSGEVVTDSNGVVSLTYETYYRDPARDPLSPYRDSEPISITTRVDGSSTTNYGSQYVWDEYELKFHNRFRYESYPIIQVSSGIQNFTFLTAISGMNIQYYLKALSKFQFPGGNWVESGSPYSDATSIKQILELESDVGLYQMSNTFSGTSPLVQDKEQVDDLQISQLYVSRHVSSGHKDTAIIDQFDFIDDAIPAFWSEKNSVDTNIWIRLNPFAFSLNQSTLVFKVREVSYAGDTGYVDVTSLCTVTTFDAGGGMVGLDVLYNPAINFHHQAVVYVSIEVHDVAPTPNIILTDYWFKVIADYRAPYIDNEIPSREEESVDVSTNIEFDVFDAGEGVDIGTLTMYVNNRLVTPTISGISGGYHVFYDPSADFYYGENVEIFVNVRDIGGNLLHDAWRFYCAGSTGPWIDRDSFFPRNCSRGVYRKTTGIEVNIYGVDDTGVESESILVTIGGKDRNVIITPIIYRID